MATPARRSPRRAARPASAGSPVCAPPTSTSAAVRLFPHHRPRVSIFRYTWPPQPSLLEIIPFIAPSHVTCLLILLRQKLISSGVNFRDTLKKRCVEGTGHERGPTGTV